MISTHSSVNHGRTDRESDQENQYQIKNVGIKNGLQNNTKSGLNHQRPLAPHIPQKGNQINNTSTIQKKGRKALGDISNKVNQNNSLNSNNKIVGNSNIRNQPMKNKSKGLSSRKLATSSSSVSSFTKESTNHIKNRRNESEKGGNYKMVKESSGLLRDKNDVHNFENDSSFEIESCFGRGYKEEEMMLETLRKNRLNEQMDKELQGLHSVHMQLLERKEKEKGLMMKKKDYKEIDAFEDQLDADTFEWNVEQDMELGEVINELGLEDEDFLL